MVLRVSAVYLTRAWVETTRCGMKMSGNVECRTTLASQKAPSMTGSPPSQHRSPR